MTYVELFCRQLRAAYLVDILALCVLTAISCTAQTISLPNNDPEAIKRNAMEGDAKAQTQLGEMYLRGEGVPKNHTEAAKWFRLAAEQEYASAQYNLGFIYVNGKGVPQNYTEAVKWYRLAAEQGHASAQYNLGVMYYIGEGVPENDIWAYAWISLAAMENKDHRETRDLLRKNLTAHQISEAQELSANIFEYIYGDR
jgi:hypothetical protein